MAVKKPNELDFSAKTFMCIISGQPGLGKTTLALSAPEPFLIDTDNGIARVRAEHRCISSSVNSYEELLDDMRSAEYKAAKTIVVDTGGTLVQLMKAWAKKQDRKAASDGRAMYGVIKQEFDRLCHQIRILDRKHLVVVFHTTEQQKGDSIQTRLACEGGAKDIVWTPTDFGGHLFMQGNRRMIGFSPTDEYFAKGCFGISGVHEVPELRPGTKNTFLTDLFEAAQQRINEEAAAYAGDKVKYDEVMQRGHTMIAHIIDADTANFAAKSIGQLEHALTSRAELLTAFKNKAKELNLKYNKQTKLYEEEEKHEEVLDDAEPSVQLDVLSDG
jgi:hypothetical protein